MMVKKNSEELIFCLNDIDEQFCLNNDNVNVKEILCKLKKEQYLNYYKFILLIITINNKVPLFIEYFNELFNLDLDQILLFYNNIEENIIPEISNQKNTEEKISHLKNELEEYIKTISNLKKEIKE